MPLLRRATCWAVGPETGDPEAAIAELAEDSGKRRALGEGAIARASEFGWDRHAAELESLYLEIARGEQEAPTK